MAPDLIFTGEEMAVDEFLGYPTAYSKLCTHPSFNPFSHGPPFSFLPYVPDHDQGIRTKELDEMFPIIDKEARPTAKPKLFSSLLWKKLNHLGNAGFDPDKFRIDPYGNVLYYHADPSSPLAWEIDHWFPCSRGGLTVPGNLRILQWQVCERKHHKLEFLIAWWDLRLGISVNQFMSIFASSNSDFRCRALSLLFPEGECAELNGLQLNGSHAFPPRFVESMDRNGLAPAAVVVSRRENFTGSSALKSLDKNTRPRSCSPIIASRKSNAGVMKENQVPDMITNPYQAIVMARDALREREETINKEAEIQRMGDEVSELSRKAEEEKHTIQELEAVLIRRKRRVEKCRRLAEAQSSYREMLEKMIRDAMHKGVIYKEQARLNQAAATALVAKLEAQKAICDAAENEVRKRFKQRNELEKQIQFEWEHTRKRSRMDDDGLPEEIGNKLVLYLPQGKTTEEELSLAFEEEKESPRAGLYLNRKGTPEGTKSAKITRKDDYPLIDKLRKLKINNEGKACDELERNEEEESRKWREKGNDEKRPLTMLEDNNLQENWDPNTDTGKATEGKGGESRGRIDEIIRKLNLVYPHQEMKIHRSPETHNIFGQRNGHGGGTERKKEEEAAIEADNNAPSKSQSLSGKGKSGRDSNRLLRSGSGSRQQRVPSSPSAALGVRKGFTLLSGGGRDDNSRTDQTTGSFLKSSLKTIKKAVKM